MSRFILRFDDFCTVSNTVLERKLLETVARCGGKIVMSIVPFVADTEWELRGPIPLRPLTREKAAILKEFVPRHAEIALHGYSHQTVTRWSHLFEFGDRVSLKQQVARLRDGRAFLEDLFGVAVETFVPPWNEYGSTTISALEESGFKNLSGEVPIGPAEGNLNFVPSSCTAQNLKAVLTAAKSDANGLVCVTLHEYDFKESGWAQASLDMPTFEKMLAGAAGGNTAWAGFEESCYNGQWGAARLVANRKLRSALASPARRFFYPGTKDVYWSTTAAEEKIKFLNRFNPRRWLGRT